MLHRLKVGDRALVVSHDNKVYTGNIVELSDKLPEGCEYGALGSAKIVEDLWGGVFNNMPIFPLGGLSTASCGRLLVAIPGGGNYQQRVRDVVGNCGSDKCEQFRAVLCPQRRCIHVWCLKCREVLSLVEKEVLYADLTLGEDEWQTDKPELVEVAKQVTCGCSDIDFQDYVPYVTYDGEVNEIE